MPRTKTTPDSLTEDDADTAVAEVPAGDAAPAEQRVARDPSPLDQALRNSRARAPMATSLWLEGREVLTTPPLAYAPGNITGAEHYNEELATSVEPAVGALTALHSAAQAVLDVREASRANPVLTEAAAVLTTADAADKLMTAAMRKLDAARGNLEAQVRSTEAALSAPLTSGGNSTTSAELRSVVRSMTQAERMTALTNAVRDGDVALASAVLGAHPLLSGMTADAIKALTAAWHRARNPQAVQKLALLNHTLDALHRAGQQYVTGLENLQGVRHTTVARIRAQTNKAQTVIGAVLPSNFG